MRWEGCCICNGCTELGNCTCNGFFNGSMDGTRLFLNSPLVDWSDGSVVLVWIWGEGGLWSGWMGVVGCQVMAIFLLHYCLSTMVDGNFWMCDSIFWGICMEKQESKNAVTFSNVSLMWLHSRNMHHSSFLGITLGIKKEGCSIAINCLNDNQTRELTDRGIEQ